MVAGRIAVRVDDIGASSGEETSGVVGSADQAHGARVVRGGRFGPRHADLSGAERYGAGDVVGAGHGWWSGID